MAGRSPSVDWVALHREYVFTEPPPTLTELAEKHGIARSGLAAKAAGPKDGMSWFEERELFRERLGRRTLEALADKWAAYETANREKRMEVANAALDNFIAQLAPKDEQGNPLPPAIKIGSKEAVEWIRLMRDEFDDVRQIAKPVEVIDGEAVDMKPDEAAKLFAEIERQLEAGSSAATPAEPAAD